MAGVDPVFGPAVRPAQEILENRFGFLVPGMEIQFAAIVELLAPVQRGVGSEDFFKDTEVPVWVAGFDLFM